MRGILTVAVIALGSALPVSADSGVGVWARYIGGAGVVALAGANPLDSLTLSGPAAWGIMLGGFGVAGMVQRGRRIAAERY